MKEKCSNIRAMSWIITFFTFLTLYSFPETSYSSEIKERSDWKCAFQDRKLDGTLVIYDLKDDTYQIYNNKRANTRFIPASTFKIANSLIALEIGAVKDESEIFVWDGQVRSFESWNKDHTLASAFRYSVVPAYQEISRRIGRERMGQWVNRLDYGNKDISGEIDKFWLEGPLKISAIEEVNFLRKLYNDNLPLSTRSKNIVKKIMIAENGNGYTLRAKTGWAERASPQIGWWVGWIEHGTDVHFFALNIDIRDASTLPEREKITRQILNSESIIPTDTPKGKLCD